jgi:hypothetical protein
MRTLATALVVTGFCSATGCSEEPPTAPDEARSGVFASAQATPTTVPITYGSETLNVWPYTGNTLDGTPVDPLHLVFVGNADPVRIRAALLALDGDRTAFGFPDAYPFNMTWGEAMGDVHTTYAEDAWGANVIQLQLGGYENVRAHLRIFGTGVPYGDDGVWTLGAAHFEVLIPGTADHQVLSWTIPRDLVVADLARSGRRDQRRAFVADYPHVHLRQPASRTAGPGWRAGAAGAGPGAHHVGWSGRHHPHCRSC